MAKTLKQRYDERNHQSGKVITPSFEEADVVSTRGNIKVEHILPSGVPFDYSKATTMQKPFNISKGALNKMRLRPQVINEHVDSSREIQAVISDGNIVGQIFKASADNINSGYLTLSSAAASTVEDFESYANDAELQAVWVATGILAVLSTTVVNTGLQSMQLGSAAIPGDEWIFTMPPADLTDFIGTIEFLQNAIYDNFKVSVSISDGINTKRFLLVVGSANNWHTIEVDINAMTEDDINNPVDDTAITSIGFRIEDKAIGALAFIDHILQTSPPGSIDLKLWNMGASLPVDGVTSIDDGIQYVKLGDLTNQAPAAFFNILLGGGMRLIHLHDFAAGVAEEIPGNELLKIGNYYAITLHYVDTDTNVWGADTSFSTNYYQNGYAFTAPDEATPISKIGKFNDLMFAIFSTQDVYVYFMEAQADAEPNGRAEFHAAIEDNNMTLTDIIHTHGVTVPQSNSIDLTYRPANLPKGGKFELDYLDDFTDDVSEISVSMSYVYKPPTVNG